MTDPDPVDLAYDYVEKHTQSEVIDEAACRYASAMVMLRLLGVPKETIITLITETLKNLP